MFIIYVLLGLEDILEGQLKSLGRSIDILKYILRSRRYPNIKHEPLEVLALTQGRLMLELDQFWPWPMLG